VTCGRFRGAFREKVLILPTNFTKVAVIFSKCQPIIHMGFKKERIKYGEDCLTLDPGLQAARMSEGMPPGHDYNKANLLVFHSMYRVSIACPRWIWIRRISFASKQYTY
jgi:hypothetical protein